MEIFKDIEGYEGFYQVSNLGRVKSLPRKVIREGKRNFYTAGKILTPMLNKKGYQRVRLYNKKGSKDFSVHGLVVSTFLNKEVSEGMVIDHIDNNPANNRVENLQIISFRENSTKDKKNKTSKFRGVSWYKVGKKWRAAITINRKPINLGHYESEEEASRIYEKAVKNVDLFNGDPKLFKLTLNELK